MMSIKRYKDGDYLPLTRYDFARKTDQQPERQDGAGVIAWIAVAICVGVLFLMAGNAGYFN